MPTSSSAMSICWPAPVRWRTSSAAKIALHATAGRLVAAPGDAHQTAGGLHHQVVTGALGIGPVLAKTGNRAVNQTRVERLQTRIVKSVLREAADLEVLHQNVALCGQLANQRLALGLGDVERDGA